LLSLILVGAGLLIVGPVAAQGVIDRDHVPSSERVDAFERRRDNIDANNIRATITNWAQTAQSGSSQQDFFYEWPKNTNRIYISLTQLWIGARVRDNNGDSLWVVDVADFRSKPGEENVSWTLEPIKGYVNPNREASTEAAGMAQSDEQDSWPPFWPDKLDDTDDPGWAGSWNGFFGKDIFNADQEFFFKVGDDQYDRYPTYFPDSTDLSRKGMGMIADVRMLAWSQILIDDAVFVIHGVTNDGTEDLDRVAFTMWLADLVGGDASDDIPFFDIEEDVAFMTDADGIGTEPFGSDPVGEAVFAFLETPGNAVDRIDNDGDGTTIGCVPLIGECNSPVVSEEFLVGENRTNGVDDNANGLIDENPTHVPFSGEQGSSVGVGFADRIDNDQDGETGGPTITAEMISVSAGDRWRRWPPNPGNDAVSTRLNGRPIVHVVDLDEQDIGLPFRDNIDNDDSHVSATAGYPSLSEPGSSLIDQAIVDQASGDPYGRYRVPNTNIVLYAVGPEDLGKAYADGIDNDGDGAIDEGIDEGFDEMIDESRSDGIDNDRDWNALQHDAGLDGVPFNGDPGDSDGVPTTGAGTDFPGERNIDKTDVSESDQIGITNVQIIPAFSLNFQSQSDRFLYNSFMIPGDFDVEPPPPGESDLVISSGLFPLAAGQTERISLSIQIGVTREEVLDTRDNALQAYLEDYQFAQAPVTPTVRAVEGDQRVTLYWDSEAEQSFDQFLAGLGRDPFDFEGYRVYRSTDPAFLDPRIITDGFGNLLFRKPIAQFDRIDGFEGFHPVDINGVKFYLGNNRRDPGEASNGLAHMFVDSTVTNGIRYFYAVTAYDYGSAIDNIPPTETPIRIRRLADGTIETGPNVVEVTPAAPVAGFVSAQLKDLRRTKGSTTSRIFYNIVDPTVIADNHQFRVVFRDTLRKGSSTAPDTLATKDFSLIDVTAGDTLLQRSEAFKSGIEFPVLDDVGRPIGFDLVFVPEPFIVVDRVRTVWDPPGAYPVSLDPFLFPPFIKGIRNPSDYRIRVLAPEQGRSIERTLRPGLTVPSIATNVGVYRLAPDGTETPVDYVFIDRTGDPVINVTSTEPAEFTADPASSFGTDLIILYEPLIGAEDAGPRYTWQIGLNFTVQTARNPQEGDVIDIITKKPFLSTDEFEFTTAPPSVDASNPDSLMEMIRVVPNPYVVTNRFEPLNPFSTGRGPRLIKFTHLPPRATVRIFTVGGKLVRVLRRDEGGNDGLTAADLLDGTLDWDLESSDNLTVSYGVYLYHVEAPGVGEKTGTFAIIK
jgi:hypothetical protein